MNRHERRKEARFKRTRAHNRKARTTYVEADAYYWHRRILKEQRDSSRVQALVFSGKADLWLKTA